MTTSRSMARTSGDYFLGSRYSYAEVLTTPFLRRAAVILPHLKDYSPLEATDRLGLDRLGRWYKVKPISSASCCNRVMQNKDAEVPVYISQHHTDLQASHDVICSLQQDNVLTSLKPTCNSLQHDHCSFVERCQAALRASHADTR